MAAGAGTSNVTFQVTDSGKQTPLSATATLGVTVAAAPAITFGSVPAADAPINTVYSAAVSATGGAGALTYTIAGGAFPDGLAMSSAGAIAGTPTKSGTFSVTVKAADAFGDSANQAFSIKVHYPILAISAVTLPNSYVGSNFSQTFAATGGSGTGYTWAITSGSAPGGITLSPAGVLSGQPAVVGSSSFSVTVTDSAGDTASVDLSLTVKAGVSVTTPGTMPTAYLGSPYGMQLEASGGSGTGYTWSLTSAAAARVNARRMVQAGTGLPPGLGMDSTGLITGTPMGTGVWTAGVTVTDSASNAASLTLTFTVNRGITITTGTTLTGVNVGELFTQTMTATGGSGTGFTWVIDAGSTLPNGITLSSTGVLSGYPGSAGASSFGLMVTDSAGNTASATFSITITNNLRFVTGTTLPTTYMGLNYSQPLKAIGGSGTGYTFSLPSGSGLPAGINLMSNGTLRGTPTSVGTFSFGITVKDSASNTATGTFTLTVNAGVTVTGATLPAGTVGTAYSQVLAATGGSGSGYIWTVTGGASSLTTLGLSVSRDGVFSGTPTNSGTATFMVYVTDSSLTSTSATFTVLVSPAGATFSVNGNVYLNNNCGVTTLPTFTVTLGTTPPQTATTDSSGNFSFSNVPNGDYTLTASISGPSTVFFPGVANISVGGASVTTTIAAVLGYKVSGTVSYTGAQTGPIYVSLVNTCGGGGSFGTAVTGPGSFTIRGVPPGTYSLQAWRDSVGAGYGYPNMSDASGSTPNIEVSTADVSNSSVALADPAPYAFSSAPVIRSISPTDQGVVIDFTPIIGTNAGGIQVEEATSYRLEWSTDPTFTNPAPSGYNFTAGASNGSGVLIFSNATAGMTSQFTNGTAYYFRVLGEAGNARTAWVVYSQGGTPAPVTIGTPSGANTITGTVTFSATPTGPLHVGFYDPGSGKAYSQRIANPVSPQAFTVQVPNGNFVFFGILDQNNDGMIDPGDISSVRNNKSTVAISGNATENLILDGSGSSATVTTQHYQSTGTASMSEGYILFLQLRENNKLPVSASLLSGRNVIQPLDVAKCMDCGNNQFQYVATLYGATPGVGDSYGILVTYSDGSTETLTGQVTAVLNSFATNLSPAGATSTGTQPTFTWTDPANPSNYVYQFNLWDGSYNPLWQIPGSSSNSQGFDSSVTSILWNVDPTSTGSTLTVPGGLTTGQTYYWQVTVQDSNGNQAQTQTYYIP